MKAAKRFGAMLAAAAMLASPAMAVPPKANPDIENVKDLVKEHAGDGETLIGEIRTGAMAKDAKVTLTFKIDTHKKYWVYGNCDEVCRGLALTGIGKGGATIDEDGGIDPEPALEIYGDKTDGTLKVVVMVTACPIEACTYGVGLFASGQ